MKRPIVFLGPSASAAAVNALADVELRPPARQGDVFRAVNDGADCIGIVDGYFDSTPAVLHKEIIWAIDKGIRVLGAASMGALRAAELHRFGMIGIGWVFDAFASGALEDDDEVAIIHAPAHLRYTPLSEAMVNIRCTLDRAIADKQVSEPVADTILNIAKPIFYAERNWPNLLRAAQTTVSMRELDTLAAWLPEGRVDIKREDALALVRAIQDPAMPTHGNAPLIDTTHLVESVRRAAIRSEPGPSVRNNAANVIARFRKSSPLSFVHELLALIDALTFEREQRGGSSLDETTLLQAANRWRATLGLGDGNAVNAWLESRGISDAQLMSLLARDARLLQSRDELQPLIDICLTERLTFLDAPPSTKHESSQVDENCSALDWYYPGIDFDSATLPNQASK
jgi:hypothetical protein